MGTTVLAYGILCSMLLFVNHPKITSQQHSLDQSAVSDCWRVCVSKDLAPLVQWVQKSAPGSARSLWKKSEKETATLTFLILQMFYLALQFWGKTFKSEEKQKQTVRLHEWTNRLTLRDDTISYCFTWLFGYGKKKKKKSERGLQGKACCKMLKHILMSQVQNLLFHRRQGLDELHAHHEWKKNRLETREELRLLRVSLCGNRRPTKLFCTHWVKKDSLADFIVPSPHSISLPNLPAGARPIKSSSVSWFVSIDRMNNGRNKPWQTMRWAQSYVSAGFSLVNLRYVSCRVYFLMYCTKRHSSSFLLIPFMSLHTTPTIENMHTLKSWLMCDSLTW